MKINNKKIHTHNQKEKQNKRKILIIAIILAIIIIGTIFFIKINNKTAKTSKIGNNSSSQEIVDYILNISSYDAKIEVEVNSNKNKNKYIIKQEYKDKNVSCQEILEPSNIAGVKITKNGKQLKIENTNLNLSSIFENYEYVSENALDLNIFIENYKSDEKANWEEKNNQIIMNTNKSGIDKKLYIDKATKKPTKLEVSDINKNTKIYISYNEVNIK